MHWCSCFFKYFNGWCRYSIWTVLQPWLPCSGKSWCRTWHGIGPGCAGYWGCKTQPGLGFKNKNPARPKPGPNLVRFGFSPTRMATPYPEVSSIFRMYHLNTFFLLLLFEVPCGMLQSASSCVLLFGLNIAFAASHGGLGGSWCRGCPGLCGFSGLGPVWT